MSEDSEAPGPAPAPATPGGLRILQPGPAFLIFFGIVVLAFLFVVLRQLLAPTILGAVAAVVFFPIHRRLEARMGEGSNLAAMVSLLVFSLFLGTPVFGAAFLFVAQARGVLQDIADFSEAKTVTSGLMRLVEQYLGWLENFGHRLNPALDLKELTLGHLQRLGTDLYGSLPDLFEWIGHLVFGYVIFVVVLFFLLRDGRKLGSLLAELSPLDHRHTGSIIERLQTTIRAVFVGGVLTAVYQASIGAVGFWLCGFLNFAVWGVLIFVASFVPVVGSALVWSPAVLYLLFTGQSGLAVLLLAFGLFISTTDNLLRILLIGQQTTLHPLVLFLAAFGGLAAGGPVGLIYGMLLAALLVETVRIYQRDFAPHRRFRPPSPGAEEAAGNS